MRNPRRELPLVDIEAYAADGGGDGSALQAGTDEGTADFFPVDIYIVRPLD